jgi:hypothetical protein
MNKKKDRDNLLRGKEKSDDDFEKNITFLSAGALALSMTFIEKVIYISSETKFCLLYFSWALLTVTLIVNLFFSLFI